MKERLNDLQLYLAQEFVDDYKAGQMTRREMLRRVLGIAGGVAAAATLLMEMGCQPAASSAGPTAAPTSQPTSATAVAIATAPPATVSAPAPTVPAGPTGTAATPTSAGTTTTRSRLSVPANDPAIQAADVNLPGDGVALLAYLAQPKAGGPAPAVMICHENRGLVEHTRDVARRFAKAGYVALALDLLSRDGGTDKVDPGQVPGKLSGSPSQAIADFQAAFRHLQTLPFVAKDKTGMVGFCFGGGITWRVATAIPALKAAVPFYGPNPPLEDVPKIQAAVLAIYGGEDQRINAGIPAIEEAMRQGNKRFEKIIYPGANHAFFNDTGANWNEGAADDAWQKTLAWLKQHVG